MSKKRKKFDYSKKKYSNPFFQSKRRIKINTYAPAWSWRVKLIIIIIVMAVLGFIWFFYSSSFFNIKSVTISGNNRIQSFEIEELFWEQADKRRFLLGSQRNINLFNENKFINTLNQLYNFENLSVKKNLPGDVIVSLEEKNYSLIWLESDNYYYIDESGSIISQIDLLEIKQKNYPLIENRGEIKVFEKNIKIDVVELNFIVKLFNEFKKDYKNYKIDRFILDNDINTIKLALIDGPLIYFNTKEDVNKQTDKLSVIINEKLKDNFLNKIYIDLRYGDRVYYR